MPRHGRSGPPTNGYYPRQHENAALQSHVAFFDTDGDGIIWPSDTFAGFRVLGLGVLFSLFSTVLIHGSLSWLTFGTLLPDPFFRLKVEYMHRGKHGSDTEAYTSTGAFDETRFNYIFDMYSCEPHTHLTFSECVNMLHGNRNAFDIFGWCTAVLEWVTTYLVLWPEDGKMKKEDIRGVYDGSLFYKKSGRSMKGH